MPESTKMPDVTPLQLKRAMNRMVRDHPNWLTPMSTNGAAAYARVINIPYPTLSNYLSERSPVPDQIQRSTEFAELLNELNWEYIEDLGHLE